MIPIIILSFAALIFLSGLIFLFHSSQSQRNQRIWKPPEHSQLAKLVEIGELQVESGSGGSWSLTGELRNNAGCDLVALAIVFRPKGFGDLECLASIEELELDETKPFRIDVLVPQEQVKKPYRVFVAEARRKIS